MTNLERIKMMSAEELAGEICDWYTLSCSDCPGAKHCEFGAGHGNGALKWLQEESEEEQ